MARQKKEDPPKGSAPWMNTFADLMNLLLCFFVLLFSMSTVDVSYTHLDELSGLMSEEEMLVAKIMRDNGNSVDFTA